MKPNLCCALNDGKRCPACRLAFCVVCLSQKEHVSRLTWTIGVCTNANKFVSINGLKVVNLTVEETSV